MTLTEKFTWMYRNNHWGGTESRSGQGSGIAATATVRQELPRLIHEFGIHSLLDAPCGDYFWMQQLSSCVDSYIGVDIVSSVIADLHRYETDKVQFRCLDLTQDPLPRADLILCRDLLVHLTYEDAFKVLANFKQSGAAYLLTTTFTQHYNRDLTGSLLWRPLNLQHAPFNFPPPVCVINEQCTEGGEGEYMDDCLGLWRVIDLA